MILDTSRRIGFHVSIGGRLSRAVDRALERGCTAFQIFCGNPRGWRLQARGEDEVRAFRSGRAQAGLDPLIVHACYLINPCARGPIVRRRSIRRLAGELALSAALGADSYVLHPGSQRGRPLGWAVRRAAEAIGEALDRAGDAPALLLENTASRHGPGGDVAALGDLVLRLRDQTPGARVGLTLDSCHAFAAGYDLREAEEVERLVGDIASAIGLERVGLIHVNDSRDPPGSRRDRHEHVGLGTIGRAGLANLLNHPALSGQPLILETPWESVETDRLNLERTLALLAAP